MALFSYKVLEAGGAVSEGKLEAGGRQDAMRTLEARGLTALRLTEITQGPASKGKSAQSGESGNWNLESKRVPFEALEDFTRSLSSLLTAGVPLSRALTILYKETSHKAAAAKWRELHDLVIDGVSLADAMSKSPDVFPRVYVAMVESGEAGGFLDVVLGQISDFQAREKELRARVTSALMYPAAVLTLATAVIIGLMVFFIPIFQKIFAGFDASLPFLTQVIVNTSDAIRHYGIFVAAGLVALWYFGRNWLLSEKNRRTWEAVVLRSPVVGPLAAQVAMARFCRMLGTLLGAGVSLMHSLSVARRSLGYQTLIDLIADSTERVSKGEALAAALKDCRTLFPGSTLEMISVAEESGRLDKELVRLAAVTEITLDRQLKNAVALAEPLLLFVIAGFIGVIFIGMVFPIFTIQDYIK